MVMLIDTELPENDPAGIIEFDAVVQVIHSGQTQITQHPVEADAALTDHAIPEPRLIQLNEAVVTDFPLSRTGQSVEQEDADRQAVSIHALATAGSPASFQTLESELGSLEPRAAQAYHKLEQWRQQGRALRLVDDFQDYENVLIQSVSAPHQARTARAFIGQITLQEVDIATTRLVDAPVTERAARRNNQGPKPKRDATEAEVEAAENLLKGRTALFRTGLLRPPGP